jgi:hypothetical protein
MKKAFKVRRIICRHGQTDAGTQYVLPLLDDLIPEAGGVTYYCDVWLTDGDDTATYGIWYRRDASLPRNIKAGSYHGANNQWFTFRGDVLVMRLSKPSENIPHPVNLRPKDKKQIKYLLEQLVASFVSELSLTWSVEL